VTALSGLTPPEDDELWVVVGPTASGKTDLAIGLAQAHGGEVIGADSVQIYRYFDLGSGKPTATERRQIPHHLVDCADPFDPYDAARFAREAEQAIADIRGRGRIPIVCGGSFLWVRALLYGLVRSAPAAEPSRERHLRLVAERGRAALHDELRRVDPQSAARLDPHDVVRVSRALEVFELTGKPQSQWHADHGFKTLRHRHRLLGVGRSRDELDQRIVERTQAWLAQGWLDEVADLLGRGYRHARAMESVGYRQVRDHLDGALERSALEEAIVRATRTLVRRQRTWLRDRAVTWVEK